MTQAVRVGVLGGTFDPIHVGHLAAARTAQDVLRLTEIRFIPSHHPPHRPGAPLASGSARLEMIRLAIDGTPGWQASDLELKRQGTSYTYDTLTALHAEGLSPSQLFFIVGADAFAEIRTWSRYPAVLDATHFAVIARHGTALQSIPRQIPEIRPRLASAEEATASPAPRVVFIEADTPDVSSTMVRERASRGDDISAMVGSEVGKFIEQQKIYRVEANGKPEVNFFLSDF